MWIYLGVGREIKESTREILKCPTLLGVIDVEHVLIHEHEDITYASKRTDRKKPVFLITSANETQWYGLI